MYIRFYELCRDSSVRCVMFLHDDDESFYSLNNFGAILLVKPLPLPLPLARRCAAASVCAVVLAAAAAHLVFNAVNNNRRRKKGWVALAGRTSFWYAAAIGQQVCLATRKKESFCFQFNSLLKDDGFSSEVEQSDSRQSGKAVVLLGAAASMLCFNIYTAQVSIGTVPKLKELFPFVFSRQGLFLFIVTRCPPRLQFSRSTRSPWRGWRKRRERRCVCLDNRSGPNCC